MKVLIDRLLPPGWLRQNLLKLISDSALISGAGAIAAIMSLLSLALSARILEANDLGSMLLAQSIVFLVGRLAGLLGWSAFTRYGGEYIARDETGLFRTALGESLTIDVCGILAAIIASLLFIWANELYDLCGAPGWLLGTFTLVHLSKIGGTGSAVLRLFGITDSLAWPQVTISFGKVIALSCVLLVGGGLIAVAVIWAAHQFLVTFWPVFRARAELIARGLSPQFNFSWRQLRHSIPFAASTHVTTLSSSLQEFDTIIVGHFFANDGVAIFRLAKDTTLRIIRVVGVLAQFSYPAFTQVRFSNQTAALRSFAVRFMAITFMIGLLLGVAAAAFFAFALLVWLGPKYNEALVPALIFSAALPFESTLRSSLPFLYATDRARLAMVVGSGAAGSYLLLATLGAFFGELNLVPVAYLISSALSGYILFMIASRASWPRA